MTVISRPSAVFSSDVAGYNRLIGADEEATLTRLKALGAELADPKIAEHRGRILKITRDGLPVEFQCVVDALRCTVELQTAPAKSNDPMPPDQRIEFRIGIMSATSSSRTATSAPMVNIAARLEGLAQPGDIWHQRFCRLSQHAAVLIGGSLPCNDGIVNLDNCCNST